MASPDAGIARLDARWNELPGNAAEDALKEAYQLRDAEPGCTESTGFPIRPRFMEWRKEEYTDSMINESTTRCALRER